MKKIIYLIFFSFCVLMATSFIRIITIKDGVDDCMVEYVMSNKSWWYMYKLDDHKYHIDSEQIDWLEEIGISRWCLMIPYTKQFSFMAVSNSFYCSVVSLIMQNEKV